MRRTVVGVVGAVCCAVGLEGASFSDAVADFEQGAYIKAFDTFLSLAQEGDPEASFNTAMMYEKGKGVGMDIRAAMAWYKKAAKKGYAPAAYNLGVLIEKEHKPHWAPKARFWYDKAIEHHVTQAYNNAALLYLGAPEVTRDSAKAIRLLHEGAKSGDGAAMFNLGILYLEGKYGVPVDKLKAYEYLTKAFQKGYKQAERYLERLCKTSPWVCQNSGV